MVFILKQSKFLKVVLSLSRISNESSFTAQESPNRNRAPLVRPTKLSHGSLGLQKGLRPPLSSNTIDINRHYIYGETRRSKMLDCSADVSFQCSTLRQGGLDLLLLSFFSFSASPSFLFEAECMFTSSPRSLTLRLSSSLSLSIWYTQATEWKEYRCHPELAQSIPKKTIRAVSALRGHRGSCQKPVCSRTVLHVPIMYCQNKEDVQKTSIGQRFFFLFSWWMSSTLTLCSYQRWQDNRALSQLGSQHSLKDHPKYLST